MTKSVNRNYVEGGLILHTLVGSTVHGTDVSGQGDRDEMGIYVEHPHNVFGLSSKDDFVFRTAEKNARSQAGDVDEVYYSLRKWVKLAANGNPTVLLPLYVSPEHTLDICIGGVELRANREIFISRNAGKRFSGYAQAQIDKLEGRKSGMPYRPELTEKYGYDIKFAAHAARLVYQGWELLSTGTMALPMQGEEGEFVRSVRRGEKTLAEVVNFVDLWKDELEWQIHNSDWPEQVDARKIDNLSTQIHMDNWLARDLTLPRS